MVLPLPSELTSPRLNTAVESAVSRWPDGPAQRENLMRCLGCSPWMLGLMERQPAQIDALQRAGLLAPHAPDTLTERVDTAFAPLEGASEDEQLEALRRFRHVDMFRILWQSFNDHAPLDTTLKELSDLAAHCIVRAADWAHAAATARHGAALDSNGQPIRMIVLGMGKLGGGELNVSSDIDLIYLYPEAGETAGPKITSNEEYFRRVAQTLTRLLGKVTADGFVYRVDTRLRPFGDSGPLVMSLDGLEHYYLTQGRDWERYAMIKAKAFYGDAPAIAEFEYLRQSFVFRRYLDYSAIEALRDLKRKIASSVRQKGLVDNIKLGSGGIREIEFIAQAFQLVRGGRIEQLRERALRQVLKELVALQLMPEETQQQLQSAYDFLRDIENALQGMEDQQTHSLPPATDEEARRRLMCLLGFTDWKEFSEVLAAHQERVRGHFETLFSPVDSAGRVVADSGENRPEAAAELQALFSSETVTREDTLEALQELGFADDGEVHDALLALCQGSFYHRLSARAQGRLDRILPFVIEACREQDEPAQALKRMLTLLRAIAGRSGYLQVLIEQAPARRRVINLVARSAFIADFVGRHPIVIDQLIGSAEKQLPDADSLLAEALTEADRIVAMPLDEQMDALRQFQKSHELRVAVAELEDELPLMRVSDQLSWLAEALLHAVMRLCQAALVEKHGKAVITDEQGNRREAEIAIVAYGKLGGIELGYGSDLDIVFLHDAVGNSSGMSDGDKPLDTSTWFARLARKVVSFMTTLTPGGVLYDIDLRLRPNGQSGVLVTSIETFAHYQREEAWTWEHQALVRARMVVGGAAMRDRFAAVRADVLGTVRDTEQLGQDVADMRLRMRKHLGTEGPDNVIDLKQDAGGIADIEFMVQYLVLAHASAHPALLAWTDNIRLLKTAVGCGVLSAQDEAILREAYLELRRYVHRRQLQLQSSRIVAEGSLPVVMDTVRSVWDGMMPAVRAVGDVGDSSSGSSI